MSLAECPRCQAEYLATATTCVDCGIPLRPTGDDVEPVELEGELVGYDLDDWTPDQRSALAAALVEAGVASTWEGAEIVVAEADADLVEELIEDIESPDALEAEEDTGDDGAARALSALYVSADVLQGDPRSSPAVIELLEAVELAGTMGLPYGLDGETWAAVRRAGEALADLLGADSDDADVIEAARTLRSLVRPLV